MNCRRSLNDQVGLLPPAVEGHQLGRWKDYTILENMPHLLKKIVASAGLLVCVAGGTWMSTYLCHPWICVRVWVHVYGSLWPMDLCICMCVRVPLWLLGVCVFLSVSLSRLGSGVWEYVMCGLCVCYLCEVCISVSVHSCLYKNVRRWGEGKENSGTIIVLKGQIHLEWIRTSHCPPCFLLSKSLLRFLDSNLHCPPGTWMHGSLSPQRYGQEKMVTGLKLCISGKQTTEGVFPSHCSTAGST